MHLLTHTHQNGDGRPGSDERNGRSATDKQWESEIRAALYDWRRHMAHGTELADPLDPVRDHVRGDLAAPVIVVEYGCLASRGESADDLALRSRLGVWLDQGQVCLAFRHFPLLDAHRGAWVVARAVEAAALQGRFWDLHDALTDLQTAPWAQELDAAAIRKVAQELELDLTRLRDDMEHMSVAAKILRDLHSGIRSGVNGAPSFYVQGIRQDVDGPDELAQRIESALAGDLDALWPSVHEAGPRDPFARSH